MRAAISKALRYPPLMQAKADAKLLRRSRIVNGSCTDTECVIRFSNLKLLHISIDALGPSGDVSWRLLDAEPEAENTAVGQADSAPVNLELWKAGVFPQRLGSYVVDVSAMVASRQGKEFRDLFVAKGGFFLYTVGQRILCFECVQRLDTSEKLLRVYEDD